MRYLAAFILPALFFLAALADRDEPCSCMNELGETAECPCWTPPQAKVPAEGGMQCPIFALPRTPEHDAICIDCNTRKEVPCAQPTRHKVEYMMLMVWGGDKRSYALYSEEDRPWRCETDSATFWDTNVGDTVECKAGWERR